MPGLIIGPHDDNEPPSRPPHSEPPPIPNAIPAPGNMAMVNGLTLALRAQAAVLEFRAEAERIASVINAMEGEPAGLLAKVIRDALAWQEGEAKLRELHETAHRHLRIFGTPPGAKIEAGDAAQLRHMLDGVSASHAAACQLLLDTLEEYRRRKIAADVRQEEAAAELAEMLS